MDCSQLYSTYGGICVMTQKTFLTRLHNTFDSGLPLLIKDITDFERIKIKLKDIFGIRDYRLTDGECIVIPVDLFTKSQFTFGDLVEIIWRLRDEDGCPWDRAQTLMSIRNNAIEEAYELVEAVEADDDSKMREEFGDVLLQGLFNGIIAENDGRFSLNDVISALCYKLISRHTHIFGDNKANNADEALKFWEQAKAKEKSQKSVKDKLDAVPINFSALLKANKVQKIIKKTGFDFPDVQSAVNKVYEEIEEFLNADGIDKEKEGGDILFAVVNVLRMSHIDSELALNGTTEKFRRRFEYIVKKAEESGRSIEELPIDEMEEYYQEYKRLFE